MGIGLEMSIYMATEHTFDRAGMRLLNAEAQQGIRKGYKVWQVCIVPPRSPI